jgi:hypothetical protein
MMCAVNQENFSLPLIPLLPSCLQLGKLFLDYQSGKRYIVHNTDITIYSSAAATASCLMIKKSRDLFTSLQNNVMLSLNIITLGSGLLYSSFFLLLGTI